MKEDNIISTLIGLVGACNNNPKTANTDNVVIKALAIPALYQELDWEDISEVINEIYLEKNTVAPNCANCASPCGNTSDYDMSRIYKAEPEIQTVKLKLLSKCQNLAAYIYQNRKTKEELQANCQFFYKALSYISFDIGKEPLLELLKEAETIEHRIKSGRVRT